MNVSDNKKRIQAGIDLLSDSSVISKAKFESIRTLVKGIDPRVDKALATCSKALNHIENLQEHDFISLSAEALPEKTEEQKKRKKAILFFINSYQSLESEIQRVQQELETMNHHETSSEQKVLSGAKIIHFAKGPFGIITIAAVIIVGISAFVNSLQPQNIPITIQKQTTQGIIVNGKKIPMSEIVVGQGPECDQMPHYHAKDHTAAKALDGSTVSDPGNCGFGKVQDVAVVEF